MLQAVMSPHDRRLYNTNRDFAHNFKPIMLAVSDRLDRGMWPELQAILKKEGVTEENLGNTVSAFCRFVASAVENPKETMNECLERSGYFAESLPPAARIAFMAMLGTVVAGMFFSGAREATLGGVGPAMDLQELREIGNRSADLMSLTRWQRFKLRCRSRIRLLFQGR